ncbi:hypothetical protein ACFYSF_31735 [Streptomyces canus]|uniref:hypothetical protein n=1 Tax=Streptomyces canus TaxID=58343 RepID=UPI0036885F10
MRRYVHAYTPALLGLAAAAALFPAPPAAAAPAPAAAAALYPGPAAVAVGAPGPVPAALQAPAAPPTPTPAAPVGDSCAPTGRTFPLTTRIHGGPAVYEAGGGYSIWYLDITNTTLRTCSEVHPVVVLVDERHVLKPSQPRLEFYDGPRIRAVRFESTDEDELVGAFGGPGLTVGPGKTLTVKVRLALTPDAVPNEVTVNAAVVQRHGDDGDWVGQSNAYRFGIDTDPNPNPNPSLTPTPTPTPTPNPDSNPHPDPDPHPNPATTPEGIPFTDAVAELAGTGPGMAAAALATVSLLLVTVGAILRARGRR